MYSMATIVNNNVLAYLYGAKRTDLKRSHHKKKMFCNYGW